jgi:hypothetical protein
MIFDALSLLGFVLMIGVLGAGSIAYMIIHPKQAPLIVITWLLIIFLPSIVGWAIEKEGITEEEGMARIENAQPYIFTAIPIVVVCVFGIELYNALRKSNQNDT